MNGILACIIISLLISHHWRRSSFVAGWSRCLQAVLEALEARDYALARLKPELRLGGGALLIELVAMLELGQLQPAGLRSLLLNVRRLQQEQTSRDQQGLTIMLRLSLAALLALAAALILERSWILDFGRNPPVVLLFLGHALVAILWLRRLPAHPLLASSKLMLDFVRAWLGRSHAGPWQERLEDLELSSWESGRNSNSARWNILEDWLLLESREQIRRLHVAEELFGLVEMASSVYFLGTACTLPLLTRFGV